MDWFTIYLWTRLDTIQFIFGIGLVVSGLLVVVATMCWIMAAVEGMENDTKKMKPFVNKSLLWFISLTIPFALMPSSKDFAMMYAIPKIIESKAIKQDLPEIYDMAIKQLKKKIIDKEGGE